MEIEYLWHIKSKVYFCHDFKWQINMSTIMAIHYASRVKMKRKVEEQMPAAETHKI